MSTEDLKKLALAATPGPWYFRSNQYDELIVVSSFDKILADIGAQDCDEVKHDAEYIAAANPAVVLELIAERDELLQAIEHIREYWNGDYNEMAITDALDHIMNVCDEVIDHAKAGAA